MAENVDNRELAIKLTGVKKRYKLGAVGGATLQEDLQSWWAKVRGKPDPNMPIGQDERLVGKSFMALNGINLEVYKGEAIGIIGGNGAGKSTMLKILSRVTAPTEGKAQIWGRIASMLEVGTGFHGELTGRENVYMNGAILGMTKAEIDAKMEDIIDFSEVREFIDTPVKRYSSGMYVKLAFSVAAHLDSEIMIMDEVLAVGDMAFQKKCLDKMRDVAKKEGRTVLYVSHNMNTIRQLCDRCIVLEKGKLVFSGDVESSISKYLGIGNAVCGSKYDLSQYRRVNDKYGKKCRITYLEFQGKELARFENGEVIRIRLSLDVYEPIERIKVIMSVKTTSGINLGLAESDVLIEKIDVGQHEYVVEFNSGNLERDEYCLFINIVSLNYALEVSGYDQSPMIPFEIAEGRKNGIKWEKQWWGNIRLNDLIVRDCECVDSDS